MCSCLSFSEVHCVSIQALSPTCSPGPSRTPQQQPRCHTVATADTKQSTLPLTCVRDHLIKGKSFSPLLLFPSAVPKRPPLHLPTINLPLPRELLYGVTLCCPFTQTYQDHLLLLNYYTLSSEIYMYIHIYTHHIHA